MERTGGAGLAVLIDNISAHYLKSSMCFSLAEGLVQAEREPASCCCSRLAAEWQCSPHAHLLSGWLHLRDMAPMVVSQSCIFCRIVS